MKKELLQEQLGLDETLNNSKLSGELVEFIENTPFTIVEGENETKMLTMGEYIVKKNIENKDELIKNMQQYDWQLILTATAIYIEKIQELKNKEN